MTKKNNREQRLLLTLSKKQDYVTAEELAEQLQTSTKTIYRLIKKINQGVKESPLILSEKGRGYQLNYEKYISQKNWTVEEDDAYSPNERRMRVLEELLLSSPKARNLYDLFEDYYVGDSVITSDEQLIAKQLKEYDLTLERKNRTLMETQGTIGVENELTPAEVAAADIVILAVDVKISGRERFDGKRIIQVPTEVAIKSPNKLIEKAAEVVAQQA